MSRRPKRLTKAQRSKTTSILRLGLSRSLAADYARCHVATLRAEMRRDPEFANQVIQAELCSETSFLKVIRAAGKDAKQWRAAAWALERLYPERYARRGSDTMTNDQVHHLIRELAEVVASELPAKDRRRIDCRLADFETNYRSHIGVENGAKSTRAGRKPKGRSRRDVSRRRATDRGAHGESDQSARA